MKKRVDAGKKCLLIMKKLYRKYTRIEQEFLKKKKTLACRVRCFRTFRVTSELTIVPRSRVSRRPRAALHASRGSIWKNTKPPGSTLDVYVDRSRRSRDANITSCTHRVEFPSRFEPPKPRVRVRVRVLGRATHDGSTPTHENQGG